MKEETSFYAVTAEDLEICSQNRLPPTCRNVSFCYQLEQCSSVFDHKIAASQCCWCCSTPACLARLLLECQSVFRTPNWSVRRHQQQHRIRSLLKGLADTTQVVKACSNGVERCFKVSFIFCFQLPIIEFRVLSKFWNNKIEGILRYC